MRHSVIFIWARICIKQRISIFFLASEYYFILSNIPATLCSGVVFIIYYSINRRRLAQYVVSVCISILLCSWYVFPLIYSTHGESFTMLDRDWFPTMSQTYISLYDLISGEIIKSGPLKGMALGSDCQLPLHLYGTLRQITIKRNKITCLF